MRIVCPNCNTAYAIDAPPLGKLGRSVRCARCKTAWFTWAPQLAVTAKVGYGLISQVKAVEPARQSDTPIEQSPGIALARGNDEAPADQLETIDYSVLGPSLVPAPEYWPGTNAPAADAPREKIESIARRALSVEKPRRSFRLQGSPALAILFLTIGVAALIAWLIQLVYVAPHTASLSAGLGVPADLRCPLDTIKTNGGSRAGAPGN